MVNDTIAAISSGITASGIGIIRISGPEAFAVLKRVFIPKKGGDPLKYRTNTIHYGHIIYPSDGTRLDECLVMIMRAPHTFTTEDTVEINCHGGPYVMKRILETVLENGARAAEPGEFTKRAFLGGRIDLSEAEAVMDVISARSDDALRSSVLQLSGSVRETITSLRLSVLEEIARIEAALDDPEHMSLIGYQEELSGKITVFLEKTDRLIRSFGEGRVIREGILTVILGKPNAGKSSLLNALTGEDRAIVTDIEGTTRDVLEEQVQVGGITLRVTDTAGIRDAKDIIEEIGIGKAVEYAGRADLILAVFDSARIPDQNDREILRMIRSRKAVVILNKSDLPPVLTLEGLTEMVREETGENIPVVRVSAKEMTGIRELENVIRNMFFSGEILLNEETVITNARHFEALKKTRESLNLVRKSIEEGLPEDFYSIDLMDACRALSEITGDEVSEDLVNMIFSRFCMGK